ncbi:MAG TPA: NmrA family NAD(P)-binding protein, partial [Tepidisphaeraceae bacterium]|nr:NmrA family NAD(P)-binding protein [Tepidisphaeraceae bacterium]
IRPQSGQNAPMNQDSSIYAITGITGQVGGTVARTLLSAGNSVRAVVRDANKGAEWKRQGCELAIAEMNDAEALTKAFAGAQAVFILLPPFFAPTPGFPEAKAVIAAVKAAIITSKPAKVVALSTVGAQAKQTNLLTQLQLLEQSLSELAMPVAFLRAAWFIDNAAWDIESAKRGGVISSFLQPLNKTWPMVATADVGRVAAELLEQSWTGRKIVELEGPRRISPNDIAATFANLLGRPVRAEAVPRDAWAGLFADRAGGYVEPRIAMLDGFNEGWICFESDEAYTMKGNVALETVLRNLLAKDLSHS